MKIASSFLLKSLCYRRRVGGSIGPWAALEGRAAAAGVPQTFLSPLPELRRTRSLSLPSGPAGISVLGGGRLALADRNAPQPGHPVRLRSWARGASARGSLLSVPVRGLHTARGSHVFSVLELSLACWNLTRSCRSQK